ncbi:MAG: N-acetylgalactosamine-4-sulfatase, partial [Phycisphaerae bacterium]
GEITDWYHGGEALDLTEARIRVGEVELTQPVAPGAKHVTFKLRLPAGEMRVQTWLTGEGLSIGAYYVYVNRLS